MPFVELTGNGELTDGTYVEINAGGHDLVPPVYLHDQPSAPFE